MPSLKWSTARQLVDALVRAGATDEEMVRARGREYLPHILSFLQGTAKIVPATDSKPNVAKALGLINPFLKVVPGYESVPIFDTDGQRTIADAENVFKDGIGPNFRRWELDKPSKPTSKAMATVLELVENAKFRQIYEGFKGRSLSTLYWEQSQVVDFCERHRDKLVPGWYFFLINREEDGRFFVAVVGLSGGGRLVVDVYEFGGAGVWGAGSRLRVVVPQLAP